MVVRAGQTDAVAGQFACCLCGVLPIRVLAPRWIGQACFFECWRPRESDHLGIRTCPTVLMREVGEVQTVPAGLEAHAEAVDAAPHGAEQVVDGHTCRYDAQGHQEHGTEQQAAVGDGTDETLHERFDDVERDKRCPVDQVNGKRRAGDAVDARRMEAQATDPYEKEQGIDEESEAAIREPYPTVKRVCGARSPKGEEQHQSDIEPAPAASARPMEGLPAAAVAAQGVARSVKKEKGDEVFSARERRIEACGSEVVADECQHAEQGEALFRVAMAEKQVDYRRD